MVRKQKENVMEDVEFEAAHLTTEPKHCKLSLKGNSTKKTETVHKVRNGGIRRSGVDGCFRQQIGHQMLTNTVRNQF